MQGCGGGRAEPGPAELSCRGPAHGVRPQPRLLWDGKRRVLWDGEPFCGGGKGEPRLLWDGEASRDRRGAGGWQGILWDGGRSCRRGEYYGMRRMPHKERGGEGGGKRAAIMGWQGPPQLA